MYERVPQAYPIPIRTCLTTKKTWPAASPAASKDGRADRPPPSYNLDTFIAVDNPRLVGPGASTLEVDDLVLGYERDGVARAFPVGMVSFHHIINDTVNGKPLLVTF